MKVRCIESNENDFRVGKIYDFDNGIRDDDGFNWGSGSICLDRFNDDNWDHAGIKIAKFEEIKEENMTYQYQPGDVVRVREDLKSGHNYGRVCMMGHCMERFKGRTVAIHSVNDYGSCFSEFWWSPEMLTPVSITFDWPQFKQARFAVKCASEHEAERFVRFIYDECGYTNPKDRTTEKDNCMFHKAMDGIYHMETPSELWHKCIISHVPDFIIPFSAFKNFKEETTMYNLEQAEAKLRQAEERQAKASREVTEARRMIEEAQKTATYPHLKKGDSYWIIDQEDDGYEPDETTWDDDRTDRARLKSGQIFTTESECQHFCDMLNYQLLVRGKALQMDGLLGYGEEIYGGMNPHVLYRAHGSLSVCKSDKWPIQQPCAPLLTKSCADILQNDPGIKSAAKKAWNK